MIMLKKPGKDGSDPGNYRGISIGNVYAKIYDIIIHDLLKNVIPIPSAQVGGMSRCSCSDAILILKIIYEKYTRQENINRRDGPRLGIPENNTLQPLPDPEPTIAVFIDVKKAFPSVNRSILLNKIVRFPNVHNNLLMAIALMCEKFTFRIKTRAGYSKLVPLCWAYLKEKSSLHYSGQFQKEILTYS